MHLLSKDQESTQTAWLKWSCKQLVELHPQLIITNEIKVKPDGRF